MGKMREDMEALKDLVAGFNGIPRAVLTKDINLDRADKSCKVCRGTGIVTRLEMKTDNGTMAVPVICDCVTRNGGIACIPVDDVRKNDEADVHQ